MLTSRLFIVAIAALIAGACGSEGASQNHVRGKQLQTHVEKALKAAGSFKFDLEMTAGYPPEMGGTMEGVGEGYFSFDGPKMQLTTKPVGDTPGAEPSEQRLIGEWVYQYPTSASKKGSGGSSEDYWLRFNSDAGFGGTPVPWSHHIHQLFLVPDGFVVEETDTDGGLTTYTGRIDVDALEDRVARLLGDGPTFSITIDGEDLPRELAWVTSQGSLPDEVDGSLMLEMKLSLDDFGLERDVEVPPAEEILTMEEYQWFLDRYGATVPSG